MPLRSLVCGAAGGIVRRPLPFQCLLLPNGGNPLVARDLERRVTHAVVEVRDLDPRNTVANGPLDIA